MPSIFVSAASAIVLAASAHGAVTGFTWRLVDNTAGAPGADGFAGAQWNALDQYTFDLILHGDHGQRINGVNMGDANAPAATPFALHTNMTVFNHPFGGNVRSAAFEPAPGFNAMRYDTFVALGSVPAANISFAGGVDLSGANGVLRATWFTTENATLDANGEMRILRVTVGVPIGMNPSGNGYFLGTTGLPGSPISSAEIGLPGGVLTTLVIPSGFVPPTPGAAALFGVVGLAGLRRRR